MHPLIIEHQSGMFYSSKERCIVQFKGSFLTGRHTTDGFKRYKRTVTLDLVLDILTGSVYKLYFDVTCYSYLALNPDLSHLFVTLNFDSYRIAELKLLILKHDLAIKFSLVQAKYFEIICVSLFSWNNYFFSSTNTGKASFNL